jgi:uncharacterized LabA/DUF88 family protein
MVKMKVMIFIDSDNFKDSIKCVSFDRKQDRRIDFYKIHNFVIDYLSNNPQYKKAILTHVRTYLYTGEYTDSLFKRIKDAIKDSSEADKNFFDELLQNTERKAKGQKDFLIQSKTYNFFEIRKKPLQFTKSKGIFQKGVDVQLAVDLVTNAHLQTFDVAVLFSGDIDLLESVKTVKNLGKHVIIFSHYNNMAQEMIREADMFINFQHLKDEDLEKFSHVFQKKPLTNIKK